MKSIGQGTYWVKFVSFRPNTSSQHESSLLREGRRSLIIWRWVYDCLRSHVVTDMLFQGLGNWQRGVSSIRVTAHYVDGNRRILGA